MEPPRQSIAEKCTQVVTGFTRLLAAIRNRSPTSEGIDLSPISVQDELGRFNCWSSNIGAFQPSTSTASLESRLDVAPQLLQQVENILNRLQRSIERAILIASGESPNRIEQTFLDVADVSGSDSDDNLSAISDDGVTSSVPPITSEISELRRAIRDTITNLFKLSMVIRQPTPRGRYFASRSLAPFDPEFDISHVWHKFPHARDQPWLVERLGKAITRRREYFRYRREHRRRLAPGQPDPTGILPVDEDDAPDVAKTSISHQPTSMRDDNQAPTITVTKATTFVENATPRHIYAEQADDVSLTSYATSTGDGSLYALRVPDPPRNVGSDMLFEYGMPFECPYCFTIQVVSGYSDWKRHVYRDLQPYVCTFEYCTCPPFSERHAWFDHELQCHRKEWRCPYCKHAINVSTPEDLEQHLHDRHKGHYTDMQLSGLIQACEVTSDRFSASECPLCNEWTLYPSPDAGEGAVVYATLAQFRRHLGKHLVQLALFALPKDEGEEEGSNEGNSNDAIADESSMGAHNEMPYEKTHSSTGSDATSEERERDRWHNIELSSVHLPLNNSSAGSAMDNPNPGFRDNPDMPPPRFLGSIAEHSPEPTVDHNDNNAFDDQDQHTGTDPISFAPSGIMAANPVGGNIRIGRFGLPEDRISGRISCRRALYSGCSDPLDDRDRLVSLKGRLITAHCAWILEFYTYKSWIDPNTHDQLLRITGGPARGKTMMAIYLSQELDRLATKNPELTVIYFFIDKYYPTDKPDKGNTATQVLRGLLIRLTMLRPRLIEHLEDEYGILGDSIFDQHSFEALWRIFIKMVRDPIAGRVHCIIDGLDDCSEDSRRRLLGRITAFFEDNSQIILDSDGVRQRFGEDHIGLKMILFSTKELEWPRTGEPFARIDLDEGRGYKEGS